MEANQIEMKAVAEVAQFEPAKCEELTELQLALIGGGCGDPIFC